MARPAVWFYRSNYRAELQNDGMYSREARAMENAYTRVFGGNDGQKVKLTFIGVMRNLHSHDENISLTAIAKE